MILENYPAAPQQHSDSYEQPPFQPVGPISHFDNYEAPKVPISEDLTPIAPATVDSVGDETPEQTRLNTKGIILVGLNALIGAFFTANGVYNVVIDKPSAYVFNFATAACWGIVGVTNSRNAYLRQKK